MCIHGVDSDKFTFTCPAYWTGFPYSLQADADLAADTGHDLCLSCLSSLILLRLSKPHAEHVVSITAVQLLAPNTPCLAQFNDKQLDVSTKSACKCDQCWADTARLFTALSQEQMENVACWLSFFNHFHNATLHGKKYIFDTKMCFFTFLYNFCSRIFFTAKINI